METLFTILVAWLLADLLSGIVHWAEDRLLNHESRFKFLNGIKADNDLHHARPTAMTMFSVWQNLNTTAVYTVPVALVLLLLDVPTLLWLTIFFASFGNLTHRWAHLPRHRVGSVIRILQRTGILISANQHNRHHFVRGKVVAKEDSKLCFCTMSGWLNPILDTIGFFKFLSFLATCLANLSRKS